MPQRPLSYCTNFPACRNKTESGRCRSCRREAERTRGSAAKRGYDRVWEKRRREYLEKEPICEHPDCSELATDVNHKDGAGPHGDNSDDNLEALCHSHHSQVTAKQHGGFGRSRRAGTCSECGQPVTNRKSLRDGICPVCRARPFTRADQTAVGCGE